MQNFSDANQLFVNELPTYNANELTSMKGNVLKLEVQIDKNDNLEADNMKLGDRLCRVSSYISRRSLICYPTRVNSDMYSVRLAERSKWQCFQGSSCRSIQAVCPDYYRKPCFASTSTSGLIY